MDAKPQCEDEAKEESFVFIRESAQRCRSQDVLCWMRSQQAVIIVNVNSDEFVMRRKDITCEEDGRAKRGDGYLSGSYRQGRVGISEETHLVPRQMLLGSFFWGCPF